MDELKFTKMHGSGNDFVLIDNRDQVISRAEAPEAARIFCRRKFGVGADGLILIENSDKADFRWGFYNADGSEAEMCGNGGRCAARFAFLNGIAPADMTFETLAGTISAHVKGNRVKLQLSLPHGLLLDKTLDVAGDEVVVSYINTGVPHVVVMVHDIETAPVFELGRKLRNHDFFAPDGANVNFASAGDGRLHVRTYERGVEDETLACGTGSVAAALIASIKGLVGSPVDVVTRGGEILRVYHSVNKESGAISEVFLEGGAVLVYQGITQELFQV